MILLVSNSAGTQNCAAALRVALDQKVTICDSLRRGALALRAHAHDVVVVEQALVEYDAGAVDAMLHYAGVAIPVFVNLAIQCAERVVREVRAAQARGQREQMK